jgi:hypothetical protein
MFYTAEISPVSTEIRHFTHYDYAVQGSMYVRDVMGVRGKFTGPSNGGAMLHSHIGRAVRICLA